MPPKTARPKQRVLVLEKSFRIQELLTRYPKGITLVEAVAELKMSKSTIFRILDTLKGIGYVLQSKETGRYSLGYKYQLLANAAGPYGGLKDISRPHLTEFAFTVGQMCHCTIRDGDEGVVVYRVQGKETGVIRIASYVGMRFALHSSAQGKILLSALSEEEVRALVGRTGLPAMTANTVTDVDMLLREVENVRVRGYAVDEMEMQENVRCIGVPAFDASGKAIAAISVTGTEFDITRDKIPGLVAEAKKCAARISAALGYMG